MFGEMNWVAGAGGDSPTAGETTVVDELVVGELLLERESMCIVAAAAEYLL